MRNPSCHECKGQGFIEELVCDTVCCKTGWTQDDGCCQNFENGTFWVTHPCEVCEGQEEIVEPPIVEQDFWFDNISQGSPTTTDQFPND